MPIEKVLYRGNATVTGGRDGRATSDDGKIDLRLTTPKELGGAGGEGTNPEQLFVGIGPIPNGFGLEVELKISLPGMDRTDAETLVERAHIVCPYSNATRGNIDVRLTIA
jgi:organic hydroperoxide reductase OsmC/OhrA